MAEVDANVMVLLLLVFDDMQDWLGNGIRY